MKWQREVSKRKENGDLEDCTDFKRGSGPAVRAVFLDPSSSYADNFLQLNAS